jgi:hypothetical protein
VRESDLCFSVEIGGRCGRGRGGGDGGGDEGGAR